MHSYANEDYYVDCDAIDHNDGLCALSYPFGWRIHLFYMKNMKLRGEE